MRDKLRLDEELDFLIENNKYLDIEKTLKEITKDEKDLDVCIEIIKSYINKILNLFNISISLSSIFIFVIFINYKPEEINIIIIFLISILCSHLFGKLISHIFERHTDILYKIYYELLEIKRNRS